MSPCDDELVFWTSACTRKFWGFLVSFALQEQVHVCFYSSHTCKELEFLSPKSWWVNTSKKSNGKCGIPNFRYLHRACILHLCYVSSIHMWLNIITTVPCIHLFLQCDISLSFSAEIQSKFNWVIYFVGPLLWWFQWKAERQTSSQDFNVLILANVSTAQHVWLKYNIY